MTDQPIEGTEFDQIIEEWAATRENYSGVNDELISAMREVWDVIEPHTERVMRAFLQRMPEGALASVHRDDPAVLAFSIGDVRDKFTAKPDAAWARRRAENGRNMFMSGSDWQATLAVQAWAASEFMLVLCAEVKDPARLSRLTATLAAISMIEQQLILAAITELGRRREETRIGNYASSFRDGIVNRVAVSSKQSDLVRSLAQAAADDARQMQDSAGRLATVVGSSTGELAEVLGATSGLNRSAVAAQDRFQDAITAIRALGDKADFSLRQAESMASVVQRIASILDAIRAVANRAKLVSVNATIEAARAGEAGRGFAVVAQEIKALAGQVATATDEVDHQLSEIDAATRNSIDANQSVRDGVMGLEGATLELCQVGEQQAGMMQSIVSGIEHTVEIATAAIATLEGLGKDAGEIGGKVDQTSVAAAAINDYLDQLAMAAHKLQEDLAA
jgi:methyl-accepting chemotaxis protein